MTNSEKPSISIFNTNLLEKIPILGNSLGFLLQVGFSKTDTDEEHNRKALISLMAIFGILAGIILAIHDQFSGFYTKGIPTFGFAGITLLGFIYFAKTKNFRFFRFLMLSIVLFFPFVVQSLHGGFVIAGSSCIWALGAPICAVMLHGPRKAIRWFLAYFILLVLSTLFDPFFASEAHARGIVSKNWFFAAHIAGISTIIFILVQYFLIRLQIEQEKSEALLLNILPRSIAERLKRNSETIADEYSEATILFADLAGFTTLSGKKNPEKIVSLLNKVFSAFDRLCEKHQLEKIKTIGDAYMVVGGLPDKRLDHAKTVAEMALEMICVIQKLAIETGEPLKIRIGINTGPVVAGIIGIKKFIYDLWGDAVNVASRMESTGIEDQIQVTEETQNKLRDNFIFRERGKIEVKGKGAMNTFFLVGKKVSSEKAQL
ncbi:MAG: adenylate/guanylate cyclase domain-containing protein [Candidatus Riflebacteria bacterium]|nr:adenylate/guanylate cyclase domain-containing protein [Candidatus Riflebacteria bacterium]